MPRIISACSSGGRPWSSAICAALGPRGWLARRRRGLRQHLGDVDAEILGECCDPLAQHRQVGRIGRRIAGQRRPGVERLPPLAALQQREALIEARPRIAGIELERAREIGARLLGHHAARRLDPHLGERGMDLGLVALELHRPLVGAHRLSRLRAQRIGVAEAQPALEIVGRARDPLLEPRDHGLDRGQVGGRARGRRLSGARGERRGRQLGPAKPAVEHHSERRQRQRQPRAEQPAPPPGERPARRGAALGVGGEHPPLDLEARRAGLGRPEQAGLLVAHELGELRAIDAEIVLASGRDGRRAAQQRQQHQRQHQRGHQGQDRPQAHPALLGRPPARHGGLAREIRSAARALQPGGANSGRATARRPRLSGGRAAAG